MNNRVKKSVSLILSVITVVLMILPFVSEVKIEAQAAVAGSFNTGDIIYYGSYPQSEVTSVTLKAALGEQETDSNGDLMYNGAKYRRCKISNTTHFYLYEPIAWQVLSCGEDGLFVLSLDILDYHSYHSSHKDITWEECSLRGWLNNTFYSQAFSASEKIGIRNVKLINDSGSDRINGGNDTYDRVFLISRQDSAKTEYGFGTTTSRIAYQTDYAADNKRTYYVSTEWWLRTPGTDSACYVESSGEVVSGSKAYINDMWVTVSLGIRPAIKLNLNTVISESSSQSSSDAFEFRVFNTAGSPISDAEVKIKDSAGRIKTASTDENGVANFYGGGVGSLSSGELNFSVTADGYVDVSSADGDVPTEKGSFCTVVMYTAKEEKYKLKKAVYRDTNSSYEPTALSKDCNILTGKKRLSSGNSAILDDILGNNFESGYFTINCQSATPSKTVSYDLFQNENFIASSTNGKFNLKISQFEVGSGIYVVVTAKDGKSVSTNLNLEITSDPAVKETSISFGEKISFSVADDVPFVGGTKLSFDIPDFPVDIKLENGKLYVGLNVNLADETKTTKEQMEEIKTAISDVKRLSKYKVGSYLDRSINNFLKSKKELNLPVVGKVKCTLFGGGSVEWTGNNDLSKVQIEVCLVIDASANKNWQTTVWIIPVTVQVSIGCEGKLNASVNYDFQNSSFNGDCVFNFKPELKAFLGAGVDKYIGVGVYGSADADIQWQLIGTTAPTGLNYVDITGELGIKVYAGPFEYTKDFSHNTWHLYTQADTAATFSSLRNPVMQSQYDTEGYTLQNLSYLENESEWQSMPRFFSFFNVVYEGKINTLISSTYRNSMPVTAGNEENVVMAYVGADSARSPYNTTKVMYSVFYDSVWSEPLQLDSNSTADTNPDIYSVGSDIYIAYQDAATEFSEDLTMDSYISSQNISVAKLNKETMSFEVEKTFVSRGSYYKSPTITSVCNIPTMVWLECSDSDILGQSTETKIMYSQCIDGTWTQEVVLTQDLSSVTGIAAGEVNDELCVMIGADADNDFSTNSDRNLLLITATDAISVCEADASNLDYVLVPGKSEMQFVYIADGVLYATSNGNNKEIISDCIGAPESVSYLNDRIICTLADEEKSEIYSLEYNANGEFSAPVALTNQDRYIERLTAVTYNGADIVTMTRKDVTINEGSIEDDCELSWMILGEKNDIVLNDAGYIAEDVTVGKDLPVYLSVSNNGTFSVDSLLLEIKNEEGKTISSQNIAVSLLSGETKELEIVFPMNDCAELKTYTIFVSSDGEIEDCNTENNSTEIEVGFADAKVDAEMFRIGNLNTMTVVVENIGIAPISGVLDIYSDEHSTVPLASIDIDTLGALERSIIHYDFDRTDFADEQSTISCVFTSDTREINVLNNSDDAYLDMTAVNTAVCGVDINADTTVVTEGKALQLNAVVVPENADNQNVSWSSGDENIAIIDNNGLLTAIKPGTVTITVKTQENLFEEIIVITVECDHNYDISRNEPTCVEDGAIIYTCFSCSAVVTEVLQKTGHTEDKISAVTPTCTSSGLSDGKYCTVCGEITLKQTIISANGHSLSLYKTDEAGCIKLGKEYYRCDICGFEENIETAPLGHNFVEDASRNIAPTCTSAGVAAYTCVRCDATNDQYLQPCEHTAVTDIEIPATCLTSGLTAGSHCGICGYVISAQTVIKATGHIFVEAAAIAPTCTTDGWTDGLYCEICSTIAKEQKLIEATGHTAEKQTDCTVESACTSCGEVVYPATEHNILITEAVPVTCTENGSTQGEYCSVCKTVTVAPEIVSASGHSYKENIVAPTCIKDGYTEYTCVSCGDTYVALYTEYTGHIYVLTYFDASCTENGLYKVECSVCGDGYSTEISATGHKYVDFVIEPTCTSSGYTKHYCINCGDEYRDETVFALGHTMRTQTILPTCTENGCDIIICSACGYNYEDSVVMALGHDAVVINEIAPGNTQDGYSGDVVCACCDELLEEGFLIPAQGNSCQHLCHRSGINAVIWKIVCFFWKLFEVNPVCACGEAHY